MVVWGGRPPPPPRGPCPTPIRSTCLTPKFLKQQDHILLSNMKHLTITFLDISLGLLWFQTKKKSVFSKQKLTPFSRKKSWINIWLQYLIMRVKTVAYKFTVYHYHSHVHYYYTHQNMLVLPWEDNSLAPKWNNKQKNVVSLNNLLKKFTYNLIYSSQTNNMSGSIKG